jgi:hypothetical protein
MQEYKITYNPENTSEDSFEGVYGISLVGESANGFKFVSLKENKKIEFKSDVEKRLLISPVLVPGQKIYRDWVKDGCTIEFDKETIALASQFFLKNGMQKNSTIEHDGNMIDGITVVELWLVDNPELDKSKHYGFDVPEGTWMVAMKVDSDNLWNNYIKTGIVTGVSIDSYFGIEKIYNDIQLGIAKKEKIKGNMLTNYFRFNKPKKKVSLAVDLLEIEVEGLGKLFATSWEVGQLVYKEEEGAQVPLLDSSFVYEGQEFKTDLEGKISDIVEVPTDVAVELMKLIKAEFSAIRKELKLEDVLPVAEAPVEDEVVEEDVVSEIEAVIEEIVADVEVEDIQALKDKIVELEALVATLKKEGEDVQAEVVALKATPSVEKLSATPTKPTLNKGKMTRAEFFASIK